MLKCPRCHRELTQAEVKTLFGALGGYAGKGRPKSASHAAKIADSVRDSWVLRKAAATPTLPAPAAGPAPPLP
jgi:hypothetical protein